MMMKHEDKKQLSEVRGGVIFNLIGLRENYWYWYLYWYWGFKRGGELDL